MEPSETTVLLARDRSPSNPRRPTKPTHSRAPSAASGPPSRLIPPRKAYHHSWKIRSIYFGLTLITFISGGILIVTLINTRHPDLISCCIPRHRGSRSLPSLFSLVATWLSAVALSLFWDPKRSIKLAFLISLVFLLFDLILIVVVPELLHRESLLTVIVLLWAVLVAFCGAASQKLVKRAQEREALLIQHGSAVSRDAEIRARVIFMTSHYWRERILREIVSTASFLAIFAPSFILFFMSVDLLLRTYDATLSLPFKGSKLYRVQPVNSPVPFRVHLACHGPTSMRPPSFLNITDFPLTGKEAMRLSEGRSQRVPTVLYESISGVAGTVGGRWLVDMKERGDIGRTCVWDRPGYGFSDASSITEMGHVVDALADALAQSQEQGPFVLVAAGYGGLLSRVFSSRHANLTHSHLFIDAHTSHTYFLSRNPRSPFFHYYIPSLLLTPLSFPRLGSMTDRLHHITSPVQNGLTASTLAQESFLSHSRYSPSFKALLDSLHDYPANAPTIVLSSGLRMKGSKPWKESQKKLWEEVVDERGRVRWTVVQDAEHDVCASGDAGRMACEEAVLELIWG